MNIFDKGDYKPVPSDFRTTGIVSLNELSIFQNKYKIYDTDTTINTIRDAIVSNYLGYDLLNFSKHGFDAKKSTQERFLEVKQCSISSKRLGGTWNDTSVEKAKAFSDNRLWTVVAVWKGASELQFMVYGQCKDLGAHLLHRVKNRKDGSRSTQSVSIETLIINMGFDVIYPPDKNPKFIIQYLINYNRKLAKLINLESIKGIPDLQ